MFDFFILIVGILLLAAVFSPLFLGVPFLPTHKKQAEKMMALAQVGKGTKVVDLGSGAGRLIFMAQKNGATSVGYELNPFLFLWTKLVILLGKKSGQVQVFLKSIYEANIKEADVIFMFLYPPHMKKIADKIFTEAKPGARILSYAFRFLDREPTAKEQGIYVYKK